MTDAAYRERLLPRWWAWLLAGAMVAMLSIAYGAALGARTGWIVAGATAALVVLLILVTAPRITVDDRGLTVGDATLPLASIGSADVVTRAEIGRLRGPGADARLFVSLRPWAAPDGVLVTLDDPDDPHPAWLISSRHPARLVASLAATMGS